MKKRQEIEQLKQYKELLNYFKRFEEKEEAKTEEKQKVLVLKHMYKGKMLKVC